MTGDVADREPTQSEVEVALSEVSARATAQLTAERGAQGLARGLSRGARLAVLIGAALLVFALLMRLLAGVAPLFGRWALLAVPLASLLFSAALGGLLARAGKPTRREALRSADGRFGLQDRLATADEFAIAGPRSSFELAAILDAAPAAARARTETWPARSGESGERDSGALLTGLGLAALLMVAITVVITPADPSDDRRVASAIDAVSAEGFQPRALETDADLLPPPESLEGRERSSTQPKPNTGAEPSEADSAALSDQSKQSAGQTKPGESAQATGASGASASRGTPSNQAQPSETPNQQGAKKPKPAKPADPDAEEPEPTEAEQDSGATAGRGSGRGSTRNPASTEWSSKDNVESVDEDAGAEDEEVEDEESDSEARGGVQPSLRDRRPPVNRDLQIGFGNQPNPDANGRGGPSEQKKSRGTASLVLGVPIPDHVKGQVNPGKTKVTQERVEPAPEQAELTPATQRAARSGTLGPVAEPRRTPWMRDLVRDYFLTLRNRTEINP